MMKMKKWLMVILIILYTAGSTEGFSQEMMKEKLDRRIEIKALIDGYYISRSGNMSSLDTFACTDYVVIPDGTVEIEITCTIVDHAAFIICDAEKRVLQYIDGYNAGEYGLSSTTMPQKVTIEIPNGGVYFRACYFKTEFEDFKGFLTPICIIDPILERIERIQKEVNELEKVVEEYSNRIDVAIVAEEIRHEETETEIDTPWEDLLCNLLCIGDSLTAGAYYANDGSGTSIQEGFPYFLERMTNITITNKGLSGRSASTVWNEYAAEYDFTAYDSYIIWLGTNNGLTDTLETDVKPYANYSDFAETETGYYCKIISRIIEQVPNARLFLGNVYASKGDIMTTNLTIEKIAEMYSDNVVGVVDCNDGTLYKGDDHNLLHPDNDVHFGRVGNLMLAKHWRNGIRALINERPEMFEFVLCK